MPAEQWCAVLISPPCTSTPVHTCLLPQFKFRIPAYYTLLVRSLTVLEGIALASDPNYKVLSAAYPWVARRLVRRGTQPCDCVYRLTGPHALPLSHFHLFI